MKSSICTILNSQIREELYSSYVYLSLSASAEVANLRGFAHWMFVQAQEEIDHAMGFYRFLTQRNGTIELQAIEKPPHGVTKPITMLEKALAHEQHITTCINKIYELALEEKDYALQSFIKWYIDEQVEEEANITELIEKMKLIGDEGSVLYLFDAELAQRTHTPTSPFGSEK